MMDIDLSVQFCGKKFKNPFILAASPSTDNKEMIARGFDIGWAGAVLKTTSLVCEEVSIAYPIMASLQSGHNMIGLHNIDLISERHIDQIAHDVVWLKNRFPEQAVIISIVGNTRQDWEELVRISEQAGADLIEVSISCPQGAMLEGEDAQGWMISQDSTLTEKVTRWACEAARKVPILVKISSNVTDIKGIASAVEKGGGNGITAIDSPEGIVGVDLDNFSPLPSVQGFSSRGGFTGRSIKPIALRCIADIAQSVSIPISGVGGIYDWQDAVQFMLLGATTLQVCTSVMHRGFRIIDDLCDGMTRWLGQRKYSSPMEIIGLSLQRLLEHDGLPHGIQVLSHINQESCIHCGLCYVACRDGGHQAIKFYPDRLAQVVEKKCVGCGLCAQVCPVPWCITIK
jgi:dihydropyrimidine dehydrogenase (NAD+) subunit PreA